VSRPYRKRLGQILLGRGLTLAIVRAKRYAVDLLIIKFYFKSCRVFLLWESSTHTSGGCDPATNVQFVKLAPLLAGFVLAEIGCEGRVDREKVLNIEIVVSSVVACVSWVRGCCNRLRRARRRGMMLSVEVVGSSVVACVA
jgi:hypothetical protein